MIIKCAACGKSVCQCFGPTAPAEPQPSKMPPSRSYQEYLDAGGEDSLTAFLKYKIATKKLRRP